MSGGKTSLYDLTQTLDIRRGADALTTSDTLESLGLTPVAASPREAAGLVRSTLSQPGGVKQPIIYIGGVPVGAVTESVYLVPLDQLRLDEPHHLLRPEYDPQADAELPGLITSIRRTGGLLEPLHVVWRQEWMTWNDQRHKSERPLLRVRVGQRRYDALKALAASGEECSSPVKIVFMADANEGEQLLAALTQQKNALRLSLLDESLAVSRLVTEFGYSTQAIADCTGEQQDRISRLKLAAEVAESSHLIRGYMAQDHLTHLTLKHVDKLRNCPDLALRDEIAQLVVQEGHSAEKTMRIVALVCPLPGTEAHYTIVQTGEGPLRLVPLVGASGNDNADDLLGNQHYWQMAKPYLVPPGRILRVANSQPLYLGGTAKQPTVAIAQLHTLQTLQAASARPGQEVDLASLVLVLQADLEALMQAHLRQQFDALSEND